MTFHSVFVTVGTTEFSYLINTILQDDVLQVLKIKGCKKIKLQTGSSEFQLNDDVKNFNISIEHYKYKDSICDDMEEADLIVTHAGAGSCLEALELNKKVIAVINDTLMNNHQIELAEKLNDEGYLFSCVCRNLKNVLEETEFSSLKVFPNDFGVKCARFIDRLLISSK